MICQSHTAFDLEAEQGDCIDLTLDEEVDLWRNFVADRIVSLGMIDRRHLTYCQDKFQVYKEFQRLNRDPSLTPASKVVDIRAPPVQYITCNGRDKGRLRLEEIGKTITSRMSENKSDDRETQCGSVSIKLPSSNLGLPGLRKRKPRGDSFLEDPSPTIIPRIGSKSIRQRTLKKNAFGSGRTLLGGLPRDINELTSTLFDWKAFEKCYLHAASIEAVESAFVAACSKPLLVDQDSASYELETLLPWLATTLKKAKDNELRTLIIGKSTSEFGSRQDLRGCIAEFRVLPTAESSIHHDTVNRIAHVVPGNQLFDLDYALLGRRLSRKTKLASTPVPLQESSQCLELVNVQPLSHQLTAEMVERQIFFGPEFTRLRDKLSDPKIAAGSEKFSLLLRSEIAFLDSRRASLGAELELQRQILKKRVASNTS